EEISVDMWIDVCVLRTALLSWMGELEKIQLACCGLSGGGTILDGAGEGGERGLGEEAMDVGRRIRKRLGEIRAEYEGKVRECSMVIDGMALSAQLSWNQIGYRDSQTNLEIARDTRQDSNQMRSIAFLTMFFLPATFIASLFSMSFFNWNAHDGERVVSPYLWIYPVLAIAITAVVVGCWFCFMRRRRALSDVDDNEHNEKLLV
ncbi:uncharacterized protein THITE_2054178, partial [Thermothielavioides terrestris NRRL 8126]